MEFGKVEAQALDNIDFGLPPSAPGNAAVLGGQPAPKRQVFTGLNMWGHAAWVGKLYAKGTAANQLLGKYGQHYNTIELNATHYKLYAPQQIAQWRQQVGRPGFVFCPKMYKGITHDGSLLDKQLQLRHFMDGVAAFEEALGPIFIQLSDAFGPNRRDELFRFLAALPQGPRFFVELRHPGWFVPGADGDALFAFLRAANIGAVITDSSGRRDVVHMQLTTPQAFVRFVGNSLHATDFSRIDQWAAQLKAWLETGLETVYFFVHMHNEDLSPELTRYVAKTLAASCQVPVPQPNFVEVQGSLF